MSLEITNNWFWKQTTQNQLYYIFMTIKLIRGTSQAIEIYGRIG